MRRLWRPITNGRKPEDLSIRGRSRRDFRPTAGTRHHETNSMRTVTITSRLSGHRRSRPRFLAGGPIAGTALASAALLGAAALGAAALGGCASTGGRDAPPAKGLEVEEYVGAKPHDPKSLEDNRKIGTVLTKLDQSMRTWLNLVYTGDKAKDGQRLDRLHDAIAYEARTKMDSLVDQLKSGPPRNRQVAAAALGFTAREEALGPLLTALSDEKPEVVANALLGLSILKHRETPISEIAIKLGDRDQPLAVRQNAGRALRAVSLYGLESEQRDRAVEAARTALTDEEEVLRMQGALLIAELEDTDSIDRLINHLRDPSNLVARAASRSLARLGSVSDASRGIATRALVGALEDVDSRTVRPALLFDLQKLSRRNYGDDIEEWERYARRLP